MSSLVDLIYLPLPPSPKLPAHASFVPFTKPYTKGTKIPTQPCQGNFAMKHVTFAYPTRPLQPVLLNVNMVFPAYQTTFIVGASGSGKSSVAALLTKLYDASYGAVELDGYDLRALDEKWIRENVLLLSQNTVVFSGSLEDNVAMKSGVDREEVLKACETALLLDLVKELSGGFVFASPEI